MLTCPKGYVKVGDTVTYRDNFGRGTARQAVVEELQLTQRPGDKYGHVVESVPSTFVEQNSVVFSFSNGWAYGHQINSIN